MITYYLDRFLLYLGFPIVKDTLIGMFAYVLAIIFVVSGILMVINLLLKLIAHDFRYTPWTYFLLIVVPVSGLLYWAAIKIPFTVLTLFPILKPQM